MKPASLVRVHKERGVALLISIFALVLISGVAVSLIMMSRTESAPIRKKSLASGRST